MAQTEGLTIAEQQIQTVWADFTETDSRKFRESVQSNMEKYDPGFGQIDIELFSHTMAVAREPLAAEAERIGLLLGYRLVHEVTGQSVLSDTANSYLESQASKFDYALLRSPAWRQRLKTMVKVDYLASPAVEMLIKDLIEDEATLPGVELSLTIAGRLAHPNREPFNLPLKVVPDIPVTKQELKRHQAAHNKRYGLGAKRK